MIIKFNKWLSKPLRNLELNIDNHFEDLINQASNSSNTILELGGVSRPVLQKNESYRYVGIDIDDEFIYDNYYNEFYCQSVEGPLPEKGDLIFSKYLMEHVEDVKTSYENQLLALNYGGRMIHLYPLGYHPFSLLNKLFGNKLARKIIPLIRKGSEGVTGYPAFYSLGNAYSLERFFKNQKGIKVEFKYHYGAVDYFSFFFPLALLISLFNQIAKTLRVKLFASNVLIVIIKED
jgi:hypothetical protein